MTAYLILENGATFQGEFFGKHADVTGEIVFTTGMTGYLETVTDPSFYGQIILQTFPLVGNYGVISSDLESNAIHAKAYIAKYPCQEPSNFRSDGDLDTFFMSKGLVGLKGIDTRALTKIIRENGAMRGKITSQPPTDADKEEAANYRIKNAIAAVSGKAQTVHGSGKYRVAVVDLGVKNSTIKALIDRGCEVYTLPHNATAEEILATQPHGILVSSGPGDPADPENAPIIENIRVLMGKNIPMFGMCMGHLFMAMAQGYKTQKLKPGHRGGNLPVKDLATGRVYITAQSHGYAVITDTPSFVNVNDGTCEGIDYADSFQGSFSVQFHPGEGAKDTNFLFDRFVERVAANAVR